MSAFYLLDNVVCSALPTKGGGDGHPVAFTYCQNVSSTGGSSSSWKNTGDNVCRVPEDDGDSWTVADANDAARGAFLYLEVIGQLDWVEVNNRLLKAKENQDRVLHPGS